MFLFQRIEELCSGRDDATGAIGRFILARKADIGKMSLQEVAEAAFTSKPTVVRFAKALGYQGWREFMKDCHEELRYEAAVARDIDFNQPFRAGDSPETIARNLRDLAVASLDDTLEQLDPGILTRVVNLMQRADKIAVFCISPHTYSAELFKRKMLTIQKTVIVANPREMGITARSLTSRDLAIIISYAGNVKEAEPMKVVEYLKKTGVPTAAITSAGRNYLRDCTDTVLTICSRERLYTKIATFSTEESVQYLLNVLYACFFERAYDQNSINKIESGRLLESSRSQDSWLPD